MTVRLNVYYLLKRGEGGFPIFRDEDIAALVGKRSNAGGTNLLTGERDLEFCLTAEKAQDAMIALRYHGYKCEIVK